MDQRVWVRLNSLLQEHGVRGRLSECEVTDASCAVGDTLRRTVKDPLVP